VKNRFQSFAFKLNLCRYNLAVEARAKEEEQRGLVSEYEVRGLYSCRTQLTRKLETAWIQPLEPIK
jgi:hypothetical protein